MIIWPEYGVFNLPLVFFPLPGCQWKMKDLLESPTEHVVILMVTSQHPGRRRHPKYTKHGSYRI